MTPLRLALLAALSSLSLTAARAEEVPPLPAEPVGAEPETTPGLRSDRPRPETRERNPDPEWTPPAQAQSNVLPLSPAPTLEDAPSHPTSPEAPSSAGITPQPGPETPQESLETGDSPATSSEVDPDAGVASDSRRPKLSFALGGQSMNSSLWDRFVEMDTQQGVWDVGPKNQTQRNFYFLTAEVDFDTEGRSDFAGIARLHLPRRLETTGTPQGQAAAKKSSSLWGFELGPLYRFYPSENSDGFFVDGSVRLGFLMAHQKLEGGSSGELTASALTYTAEVAAGYRFLPQSSVRPFVRGGFSFSGSGKFSVNQASGSAYSDFGSGDRVAVRQGSGYEDLSVSRSGAFITVGLTWMLGEAEARPEAPSSSPDLGTPDVQEDATEAPSSDRDSGLGPTPSAPAAPSPAEPTPLPAPTPDESQVTPLPEAEIRDPLKAEPVDPNWIPEPLPSPASPSPVDSGTSAPAQPGEYPATTPDADVAPQKIDFTEWY